MRYVVATLGIVATGVFLAVSMTMNWRFGVHLGRTELDGQIYGAASAAADCFKALVPFFFFAALKNRQWAPALATVLVGIVVTAYSLTSALGHAALNRFDTASQRTNEAETSKDNRADLARAKQQLTWIPEHRPAATVTGELDSIKTEKLWTATNGCKDIRGPSGRAYCQRYHGLEAELGSANSAAELETRISGIESKIAAAGGDHSTSVADPQAAVLAGLLGLIAPNVHVEGVQTALTVFIALLLEVTSSFGLYITLSYFHAAKPKAKSSKASLLSSLDLTGVDVSTPVAPAALPRQIEVEVPPRQLSPANDQDAVEDDLEDDVENNEPKAHAEYYLPYVRAWVEEATEAVEPRHGAVVSELLAHFKAHEAAQGRSTTDLTERMFQNICSFHLGIDKRRLGHSIHRKIYYAIRPVQEVPVRAAA